MKFLSILFVGSILLFSACVKKATPVDDSAKSGNLTIKFSNNINGAPILKGQLNYTNQAGNLYSVSLLKYYVTNAVLIKSDGTEFKLNNYDLIDAFEPTNFSTVNATNVPYGSYSKLRFYMGIDKARNHSGAQDGDLDPIHNMIWTWNTGYLFIKHEGSFVDSSGNTNMIQYHLGTDDGLAIVEIPITLDVTGSEKKLNIAFDLNNMYNSPKLDFNEDPVRHSTASGDVKWVQDMKANTADAFSFVSQE